MPRARLTEEEYEDLEDTLSSDEDAPEDDLDEAAIDILESSRENTGQKFGLLDAALSSSKAH